MTRGSSQNYDGGLPRVAKPKVTLSGRPAPALPSRGRHPMHGVGAQKALRYCECGARKRAGVCPRCEP